jgi:hypothetical protein
MLRSTAAIVLLSILATPAFADSSTGLCTLTPKGEKVEPAKRKCWIYQAQGHVVVGYEDEDAFLDLMPTEGLGNYTDPDGKPAYRNKGLGDKGVIYRGEFGTVRFYWGD